MLNVGQTVLLNITLTILLRIFEGEISLSILSNNLGAMHVKPQSQ